MLLVGDVVKKKGGGLWYLLASLGGVVLVKFGLRVDLGSDAVLLQPLNPRRAAE